jgi:phenylpropionate dioxygenase-like ring-hydroxylating dioxygenase large terminal subunit
MGLLRELNKIRGGWPGGWREFARGYGRQNATPPFVQPHDPDDRRSLIPTLGLKEYWYPAIPADDIGWKKPVGLKLAGDDLVFFRDKAGEVQALWDYCPHRGAYLSWGDCFWKGSISCPYHGATFDGNGECIEFITEGPDSKMVGRVKAKKYPTVTLKGLVFVWMGEGEPVDPKEDIPPEFFEKEAVVQYTFRYWDCNWMIALENTGDAHNMFYVHRNSFRMLRSKLGGRPRTPVGYRSQIYNDVVVKRASERPGDRQTDRYYEDEEGEMPFQLYYPRVDGYWPKHRWRLLWAWFFEAWEKTKSSKARFQNPPEWEGQRLPCMVRNNHRTHMYTRCAVPVDENLTRAVYYFSSRPKTALGRMYDRLSFRLFLNWMINYNFSDQDYDAMRSCRYQYPEYLSSTDGVVVALRRLVAERARGVAHDGSVAEETTAERLVAEADKLLGVAPGIEVSSRSDT